MGTISRKDFAGIIGDYDDDTEPVRFCPHCLEYNLHNELGPRIYEILKPGEKPKPLPHDANNWLQCNKPNRGCGRIYPVNQTKVESSVKDFAETQTNPHDQGRTIVGLGNKRTKKSEIQKERERQRKAIDAEKDEDIKREMRAGRIVERDSGD